MSGYGSQNHEKYFPAEDGLLKCSLRKGSYAKSKTNKEYPKGVTLLIPQSTIITNDKFKRLNITRKWQNNYANQTSSKRAYIFKTLQSMRKEGKLRWGARSERGEQI